MPLPLIKITEVMLAINLPKRTNENNGFTYMHSVKPNFYKKPQKAFTLCKTSFYQCIPPKWTNTYAPVCTAHDKDVALSHQSFIASITVVVLLKRAIWLTSLLIGQTTDYQSKHKRSKSKFVSFILPTII
jgi:hypothetical protein